MSRPATDTLNQEKIRQLLDAVGARSAEDTSGDLETVDFDWRQARYFNLEQLAKAAAFAENAAAECVEEFSRLYQGPSTVKVVSTHQRFSLAFERENEEQGYYIPFGPDSNEWIGLLNVPRSAALLWTGLVLGSTESTKNTDRTLSKLEETFLLDIASGLIKSFSRAYGAALQVGQLVIPEESSFTLNGSDELYEIVFEPAKADAEAGGENARARFLICCDKLKKVTGQAAGVEPKLSEAQIRNAILEHVHHVPVTVSVRLGTTRLAFKDVMGLQANDIVVLNKKITEPVELLVESRTLLSGYPAQSDGNYAVVIA